MKKTFVSLAVLLTISSLVFAQEDKANSGNDIELNCYDKYEKVLNVRGCEEVRAVGADPISPGARHVAIYAASPDSL